MRWLLVLVLLLAACTPVATVQPAAPSAAARVADQAVWAPGELAEHWDKHPEGYRSQAEYDAGARETIRTGTRFTYLDTQSRASRIGYFDAPSNRFTGLTGDERRITTHFRPDRGAAYVRGLPRSTYR